MPTESSPPYHDDEVEPMTPEHFDLTVSAMSFKSLATVRAARAVMVEGVRPGEAVMEYDVPQPQLSRAVSRIEKKWRDICDQQNWVCEPVALPPDVMALVRHIEIKNLEPLREKLDARKRRNSARKTRRSP